MDWNKLSVHDYGETEFSVRSHLSGAKLTAKKIGTGQIHCNANGIRYAHWSSLSTVPRRTPVEMKPPITQHRLI